MTPTPTTPTALTGWLNRVADGQGHWLTDSITGTLEARDIIETLPEDNTWGTDEHTVGIAPTPNGGWVAWLIEPNDATIVACDTLEEAEENRDDLWHALVEASRDDAAGLLVDEGYDRDDVETVIDSWVDAVGDREVLDDEQVDLLRTQLGEVEGR